MALKDKRKSKNLFESIKHAFEGIIAAIKNERNLKIDLFIMLIVIICGFIFKISLIEWAIVTICIALVISLELVNTAIEEAINLAMPDINPIAKLAKDVSAGAVLFSAVGSVAVGLLIFIPKLIELL